MTAALNYTLYDDANDDFKYAANENIRAIFTENRVGFSTQ